MEREDVISAISNAYESAPSDGSGDRIRWAALGLESAVSTGRLSFWRLECTTKELTLAIKRAASEIQGMPSHDKMTEYLSSRYFSRGA
jgi:hypothetical protein